MTSVLARAPPTGRLPDPVELAVTCYADPAGNDVPIPWRYNKQTSAIDIDFVNGFTATTTLSSDNTKYYQGQTFGAIHLALKLGSNFIQWCESSSVAADAGTVVMIQQPIVAYGNLVLTGINPAQTADIGLANNPLLTTPAGPVSSQYYKTLIFQRALVIQYKVSGVTNYAVFQTNFNGNT